MLTLDPDVKVRPSFSASRAQFGSSANHLLYQVVFLGDLNEFSNVQPLDVLSRHLVELLVPEPTERYSFQFDQYVSC